MFIMKFCWHGSNFRQKSQAVLEYVSTRPSPPLSKDEGLKDIGHSMNIGNLILSVNSVTLSYFICYILLQNATDIITKCDKTLFQNASDFLLQNATILLQDPTVIENCDSTINHFNKKLMLSRKE